MPPIRTGQSQKRVEQEGRIEIAIQALRNKTVASINEAARVYEVPRSTLHDRARGLSYRETTRANCSKLDKIEEDSLERWILDMDARGKAPTFAAAREMANILLAQRSTNTVDGWMDGWMISFTPTPRERYAGFNNYIHLSLCNCRVPFPKRP